MARAAEKQRQHHCHPMIQMHINFHHQRHPCQSLHSSRSHRSRSNFIDASTISHNVHQHLWQVFDECSHLIARLAVHDLLMSRITDTRTGLLRVGEGVMKDLNETSQREEDGVSTQERG
jgi:hypothetical protein